MRGWLRPSLPSPNCTNCPTIQVNVAQPQLFQSVNPDRRALGSVLVETFLCDVLRPVLTAVGAT